MLIICKTVLCLFTNILYPLTINSPPIFNHIYANKMSDSCWFWWQNGLCCSLFDHHWAPLKLFLKTTIYWMKFCYCTYLCQGDSLLHIKSKWIYRNTTEQLARETLSQGRMNEYPEFNESLISTPADSWSWGFDCPKEIISFLCTSVKAVELRVTDETQPNWSMSEFKLPITAPSDWDRFTPPLWNLLWHAALINYR